ncbi:bifunctional 3-deoxy-7-phosphoheptulonate synthase/chorismate mutase type II [Pontibacter sp. G13]|uniref:bifunctional 3-deoxy-7-phosphoheptulonate synthase/chorismate mutase type II n=1 Tax=Pontibacter sp. G13 TaxID=3074898 RepID=UPI00288B3622|nr:bifunctional 3-deoxy-7-phosphoheptulonate synthase/chorismate mutase type II [Pontibacter sp. G13]WNJ17547.1 bifunctional 3-deoxy-7-phosphoheptulonate synthase/chorismate mutase type II [Pontibacter sp. G13]
MKPLEIIPMKDWGLGLQDFVTISGPCSAETEEQVMQSIQGVAQHEVHILRAGIWKPRTRPNSFEGIGSVGLKWLKDAGEAVGKPVCVEVANVKHVYEALRTGIDILWLGARTTTNPFAVQEIADALKGVDIPVMVKNPVNPDLQLWIGAMERLQGAGITKMAAIHRGFSTYGKSKYRNQPQWEIPIELRRTHPNLPIVCDPSHICGTRDLLFDVSQKALDLNFNGLMLESHINPEVALSDKKQQVTPDQLGEILGNLVFRQSKVDNPMLANKLELLREEIDELDHRLIDLLAERMQVVEQIGRYKKENNVTIYQNNRWNGVIRDRIAYAEPQGISPDILAEILQMIHKESIRHQTKVMNQQDEPATQA